MLKIKIMNDLIQCGMCGEYQSPDVFVGLRGEKCACCQTCRHRWWKCPEKNLKKIKERKENGGKTVKKENYIICKCGYKIRNIKYNIDQHKKTYKHKRGKEEIQKTHHTCECGCVVLNTKWKIEKHKETNKHKRLMESLSN